MSEELGLGLGGTGGPGGEGGILPAGGGGNATTGGGGGAATGTHRGFKSLSSLTEGSKKGLIRR